MSNRVNIGSYNNMVGPSARKLNERFVHSFVNFLHHTGPQKLNMDTSLRERTAQNGRSFKLSDRFEQCANSFFC
jgi:hypothetical protein